MANIPLWIVRLLSAKRITTSKTKVIVDSHTEGIYSFTKAQLDGNKFLKVNIDGDHYILFTIKRRHYMLEYHLIYEAHLKEDILKCLREAQ